MKIVFWSNIRKKGGVTTNLACMAGVSAISGMRRLVLLENHYNMNNLSNMLLSQEKLSLLREQGQYYNKYGIEYLLKRLYNGEVSDALIHKASLPLLYSSIYYLPQSYIVNKEVFDYEFELVRGKLFECLESFSEWIFVDAQSTGNASTVAMLQEADLLVVNLNQNPESWDSFFENYESLNEKAVFLIGQYQQDMAMNMLQLRRKYHIDSNRIGAVPLNIDLDLAIQEGRLLQFLNHNFWYSSRSENTYFIRELKQSASMIRENMIRIQREKDRRDSVNSRFPVFGRESLN